MICAMQGRTPATAWPVMMPCVYSGTLKPETYAKMPFWQSPADKLAMKTMSIRNPKYAWGLIERKKVVEMARRVKDTMLRQSAATMRRG